MSSSVVGGCAEVGSELRESLARIHTRTNAHREILENAISAGATRMEIEVLPATEIGAFDEVEHHDVLRVYTDTYVDLKHALTIGHAKKADDDDNIGALNNFGVGMYVFQSNLGEHAQATIYTMKRVDGVDTMTVARTGSLQDQFWSGDGEAGSGTRYISRVIMDVVSGPPRSVGRNGQSPSLSFDKSSKKGDLIARGAMLEMYTPFFDPRISPEANADNLLQPMYDLRQRLAGRANGAGTCFLYHAQDGVHGASDPLPYELSALMDEDGHALAHRLLVRDKQTHQLIDVLRGLQAAYMDDDGWGSWAVHASQLGADTTTRGAPALTLAGGGAVGAASSKPASAMPQLLVQSMEADFSSHPWPALLREPLAEAAPQSEPHTQLTHTRGRPRAASPRRTTEAAALCALQVGPFEPIFLPESCRRLFPAPIAFFRSCFLPDECARAHSPAPRTHWSSHVHSAHRSHRYMVHARAARGHLLSPPEPLRVCCGGPGTRSGSTCPT